MQTEIATTQPRTSPLAIWSLVLGIVSMLCGVCVTGIPAIILGIMALNRIKKSPGQLGGQGLALAGLVTGGIGTLLTVVALILASLLVPAVGGVRAKAHRVACLNNVLQMTIACVAYAHDHDHKLPTKLEDLKTYLGTSETEWPPKVCICPTAEDQHTPSYELLNGGRRVSELEAAQTIIIREIRPNHQGMRLAGYLDGQVWCRRE